MRLVVLGEIVCLGNLIFLIVFAVDVLCNQFNNPHFSKMMQTRSDSKAYGVEICKADATNRL